MSREPLRKAGDRGETVAGYDKLDFDLLGPFSSVSKREGNQ